MAIPANVTLHDLYALALNTREEFRQSMANIQDQVSQLNSLNRSMENVVPRVEACESRIAKVEYDMDVRLSDHDKALQELLQEQDEYPVDRTLVCTGLPETTKEDIRESAQDIQYWRNPKEMH